MLAAQLQVAPKPTPTNNIPPVLTDADFQALLAANGMVAPAVFNAYCQLLADSDLGFAYISVSIWTLKGADLVWGKVKPMAKTPNTFVHPVLVDGHWWLVVLWPFLNEYLVHGPAHLLSTANFQSSNSQTIRTKLVTMTLRLFNTPADDLEGLWEGKLMTYASNEGNGGVLCMTLARVVAEARVPIAAITRKSEFATIRKRFVTELRRGEVGADFGRYAVGELRY